MSAASKNVGEHSGQPRDREELPQVSVPSTNESGIDPSSTARPRSAQMRTGRRRSRSTHAPATSPTKSVGDEVDAAQHATSIGPAPSVRIASSGSAIRVISDPKIDTRRRAQTRTNAWLRQSGEPNGLRTRPRSIRPVAAVLARTGPSSGAFRATLRYTAPPRCVRTRAPPDRPATRRDRPALTNHGSPDRAVFDTLSERLRATLGNLTGRGRISEADVDAAMREVRLALLEADVNFKVVKDFVARVREKAIGSDVLASLTAGQQVVKIVHDELVELLSAGDRVFHLRGNPAVVAMVGLQGSGKTTTTAKLARHIVKQGRRPLLVAADPYRPAAADQLETLGKQLDIPVYRAAPGTRVPDIARQGVEAAKRQVRDVVILDTAGRLSIDEALMQEIAAVNAAVKPVETLLVVDAMTGQEAVAVAQAFVAAVPVTGLILTKIDGDARGGAALSISAVTGLPIKFLGTGEKTDALEVFHPDRLAGRILGHGRHPDPRRAGAGDLRRQPGREDGGEAPQGELHARGHARAAPAGPEDGPDRPDHGHDPGHGQHGRRGPGRGRPRRPQADRGDHPGDDPGRAPRSRPILNALAPPPHRGRRGHRPCRKSTGWSSSSARCRSS